MKKNKQNKEKVVVEKVADNTQDAIIEGGEDLGQGSLLVEDDQVTIEGMQVVNLQQAPHQVFDTIIKKGESYTITECDAKNTQGLKKAMYAIELGYLKEC
jgi:hypothetical protein